jgi:hypothetical protein
MKRFARLTAVFIVLLISAGIAAASGPPQAFSTTGFTASYNYEPLPLAGAIPGSGYLKFHLTAQGGAEDEADDLTCAYLGSLLLPPMPPITIATCAELCTAVTGQSCGVTGDLSGSFAFDEWGVSQYVVYNNQLVPVGYAANHGLMTVTTAMGDTKVRFGGIADYTNPYVPTVEGSYLWVNRTNDDDDVSADVNADVKADAGADADVSTAAGVSADDDDDDECGDDDECRGLKADGVYAGDAGLVFKVDYLACSASQNACPAGRCAVFGDDFRIESDRVAWKISNAGEIDRTISRIVVVWPEDGGKLTSVRLSGDTIYARLKSAPSADINNGWAGRPSYRRIEAGETAKLEVKFNRSGISTHPWDYTILVEFAEGCAVSFVAFPQ